MWGVFSSQGLLLGQFSTFEAAEVACRAWLQAVAVHWMGTVMIDR